MQAKFLKHFFLTVVFSGALFFLSFAQSKQEEDSFQPNKESLHNINILNGSAMPNLDSGHIGDRRPYRARAIGTQEKCTRKEAQIINIM